VLVAMGFLMKTMPQINILSVGFAIKIVVGLTILAATLYAIDEVVVDELSGIIDHVLRWSRFGN
jgi:flagellar biosynthesis protein FliR